MEHYELLTFFFILGILKENNRKAFEKIMAEIPEDTWNNKDKLFANEENSFWDSDDAVELLESLFDEVNNLAPEGYYFGSTEGDASDFGFWQKEDY